MVIHVPTSGSSRSNPSSNSNPSPIDDNMKGLITVNFDASWRPNEDSGVGLCIRDRMEQVHEAKYLSGFFNAGLL
ncbi:hypothetical protein RIF29_17886 [Crotalaria pallida]|uniref:Uncharacterized protein n=1 Tax=Crotalaria pallida TaxID=3830 RepID=A0AAN9FK81_CROPI